MPPSSEEVISLIQQARAGRADPPALIALAQKMLADGFELTCEFINILRNNFGQYWLRLPEDLFGWTSVLYFSKADQLWSRIDAGHDYAAKLLQRDWEATSEKCHRPFILLNIIGDSDLKALATAGPAPDQTFADEMVSSALIELRKIRIRSAIVHTVIAYEIAAKRGLEILLRGRLKGLESGSILEAISREVSTVTLGKIVLQHATEELKEYPVDWSKIDAIYNTRNMIVHRGRRRMPLFEEIKAQVIEVRGFVLRLQSALGNVTRRPDRDGV